MANQLTPKQMETIEAARHYAMYMIKACEEYEAGQITEEEFEKEVSKGSRFSG